MEPIDELNKLDLKDELFEDEATSEKPESDIERPYDPSLIRVEPKMFSLRNIMDFIDEGDLDLAPDFQRLRVWKLWQKSRLIESLLLRIPLPAFYFASDSEGKFQVVDGVQRLSTIYDFVRRHGFALTGLEYLSNEVGGKYFEDLKNSAWAKRIYNTQIIANVIDPQTPMAVKFDIFKRINTGGTPLNAQEIRHCMSGSASRSLLSELTLTDEFNQATNGRLSGHVRMEDREVVLRVIAMYVNGTDGYMYSNSMDAFLNQTAESIDDGTISIPVDKIKVSFIKAMRLAYEIFGKNAFRKWPNEQIRTYPINKAIFESLGAILCRVDPSRAISRKDEIIAKYRDLCSEDISFVRSVSQSTSDPVNVMVRYKTFEDLFSGCYADIPN